jgi:sterol 3beta-glucosyltransferase
MRIAIIAFGSRGDVQPYVALGKGLQDAGHTIRFVTTMDFEDLVREHGLQPWVAAFDIQEALQQPEAARALESGKLFGSFKLFAEIAQRGASVVAETGLDACREVDAVLSGFSGMLLGWSLAEKLGLRFIQAYNVPITPTGAFPGVLLPGLSFWPRPLWHRLSHRFTRQMLWQTARNSGNRARAEILDLPPAPLLGPFDTELFLRGPVFYGLSPSVLPKPDDWGPEIEVTGFWTLPESRDWSPPDELLAFLEGGSPPVYLGFGSMSSREPRATTDLVARALERTGQRAIVVSGWSGIERSDWPSSVFVADSLPHSWLFQRVSAVVHHGGAGTTAAGFRAGVPSIIVPFHGDQPFWGQLAARLGVGPRPVPRRRLTAERLARTIDLALGDVEMQARAARLGNAIRAENGVAPVVEAIGRLDCP